jgi:hypothetical protein
MPKYTWSYKTLQFLVDFWAFGGLFAFEKLYKGFFLRGFLAAWVFFVLILLLLLLFLFDKFFFSWKRSGPFARALMTFGGLTCQMFEAPYQVLFFLFLFFFRGKWVAWASWRLCFISLGKVSPTCTQRCALHKTCPFVYWHVGYVCVYTYISTIYAHIRV